MEKAGHTFECLPIMAITNFVQFVHIAIVISCCHATYVKSYHPVVFRPPMLSLFKPFHPEIYNYPMKPFFRQTHPPMFPAMIKLPFKVIPVIKSKLFMKPMPFSTKLMPIMIKKLKYMKVPKIPIRYLRPKSPPKYKLPTPGFLGNVVNGYRPPRPQYPNRFYVPQPAPQPPRTYGGINFAGNDDDNDDDDDSDDDDDDDDDDNNDDEESNDNMKKFPERKNDGYHDNADDNIGNRLMQQTTQQFRPGNTPVQSSKRTEGLAERQNKYEENYFETPGNRLMQRGQQNQPFNIPARSSQRTDKSVEKHLKNINNNGDRFNNRAQQVYGSNMPISILGKKMKSADHYATSTN